MANKSKKKGTEFETKVVNYLKSIGLHAERVALSGMLDCGDVVAYHPEFPKRGIVIECKNYKTYTRKEEARFRQQAVIEAENYNKSRETRHFPILIMNQYNKPFNDSIVEHLVDGEWFMMYLDEHFKFVSQKEST